VLALYALAMYLAHGERRETLRNIGFAIVLIGLIVLVVRRVASNEVVDTLTSPQGEDAGRQAWLIASELLSQLGWAEVLYGAIVVAGAIFAGPTAAATSVRGRVAPVLNERPVIAWAAVGAVFLLLVLWGGTHALRTWWGILLLGALLAIAIVALRHQTQREFPGGKADAVAGKPAPA
jgi:drug/metabolite transporter (DMT)-like permease